MIFRLILLPCSTFSILLPFHPNPYTVSCNCHLSNHRDPYQTYCARHRPRPSSWPPILAARSCSSCSSCTLPRRSLCGHECNHAICNSGVASLPDFCSCCGRKGACSPCGSLILVGALPAEKTANVMANANDMGLGDNVALYFVSSYSETSPQPKTSSRC